LPGLNPGIHACAPVRTIAGLYYHNYASGTGLMAGAVFGRIAGKSAAAFVRR
jgi:tricarballylate dehydrogenase